MGGLSGGACASFVGAAPCAGRGLVPELRSGPAPRGAPVACPRRSSTPTVRALAERLWPEDVGDGTRYGREERCAE